MPLPTHGAVGLAFLGTRALQLTSLLISLSLSAKFISSIIDSQQSPPAPLIGVLSVVCFAVLYCVTTLLLYWDNQLPLLPTAALDGLFFLACMISAIIIGKPLSYLSCKAATGGVGALAETLAAGAATPTPTLAAVTAAVFTPAAVTPYTAAAAAATVYTTTTATLANTAATVVATLVPGGSAKVLGSDGNTYTISKRQQQQQYAPQDVGYEGWLHAGGEGDCVMMKAVWGFGIALTILFVFSAVMVAFIWKAEKQRGMVGRKAAATGDA
ncbi:hypothetical protein BZA05DRAFT_408959 [Tricharina praecox]|uniref:uncharacterized protein n=1 Tax=Tricharina praecox TaxID=43433 RepID=UPI00221F76C2|nr:uncharacterized protein BZA05DRAFT_408959 [Tricharina praecox]KAI5844915.1 hypothetical protein BZA05DRAFT_408959 [Tricharina praecox]